MMNDKFRNTDQEDSEIARKLHAVAEKTNANAHFLTELEHQLKEAHQPKANWSMPGSKRVSLAFGWVAFVIVMGLALSWSIRNLIPNRQPGARSTPTHSPSNNTPTYTALPAATPSPTLHGTGEYTWRSTKLNLSVSLPAAPTEAKVYALNLKQPVTPDDVLALAQRFGIQGEVQELPPDSSDHISYMLTDGTQRLELQSNHHFVFYTNYAAASVGTIPEEQARVAIDNFLKQYGFDFEYHVESAPGVSAQQYIVIPLTPDGAEIRTDYLMAISYEVTIDGTGQVLAFSGFPLEYEEVGTFQLITAEEAFESVLADSPPLGRMESIRGKNGGGGGGGPGFYKLNLSGTPVPFPTALPQPNVPQDSIEYIVTGNDTLASIAASFGITIDQLVQANDLPNANQVSTGQKLIIPGRQQQGEGFSYTVVEGDTCASIASTFQISIQALITNNNLSANCVIAVDQVLVIPAPQSASASSNIGKRLEDQRGIFMVNIYHQPDGSQRKEYAFLTTKDGENFNLKLEGARLQELESYHNLPINIWGTITGADQSGNLTASVERYIIPFPDLSIQIFQGQQKATQINGQSAVLFTAQDGKTYIQAILNGDPFVDNSLMGQEGDQVLLEGFNAPDDFNNGYPVLRIFGGALATAKDGQPEAMTVTADQPNIYDETPNTGGLMLPTVTIEQVELVYYLPNLQTANLNPGVDASYIQPTWRFHGHYSTGDEFEILIQALQREFLLPELAPYTPPG